MKRFIAFVLVASLVMSLVACTGVPHASDANEREVRFQKVDTCCLGGAAFEADVCVDTHTGVLYVWCWNTGYSFMTPLLNADGTPMVWGMEK